MDNTQKIRVVELFAGVGGFRVGLERCSSRFETVWASQWEPGQAGQWAYKCYCQRFGDNANCSNEDIAAVTDEVPEHDLLVGGFPCQDYSVAHTGAKGIEGKKGVLWWSIDKIIKLRHPKFILLENVDRLLKSPAKQRGRDFAIILACLSSLGYSIEWRVINAADYGFPQRRRRTFIFATRDKNIQKKLYGRKTGDEILLKDGFFAPAFPCRRYEEVCRVETIEISDDIHAVSDRFHAAFENSGYCIGSKIQTLRVEAVYDGPRKTLGECLEHNVDESFYIKAEDEVCLQMGMSITIQKAR